MQNDRMPNWEDGWAAGRITVDDGETIIDAEYRTDQRWNGWLCPRMKFDAAMEALRALAGYQPGEFILMLVEGEYYDAFVLYEEVYADEPGYEPEIFVPDLHGWYSPGYMAWCWYLVSGESE
jgi:hypothetical protein